MQSEKIPFLIVRNFISPLACENVLANLKLDKLVPTFGQDGRPKKMLFANKLNEMRLMQIFDNYVETLEEHFDFEYLGTYSLMFEWLPEGYESEPLKSDGYVNDKNVGWKRYRNIDFTGILFLNEYEDSSSFDDDFEVNGGDLNFPTFDFSFRPERGTLVIFPVAPNFIHNNSNVNLGSLCQVRFTMRATVPYEFNKDNFSLNHEDWNID